MVTPIRCAARSRFRCNITRSLVSTLNRHLQVRLCQDCHRQQGEWSDEVVSALGRQETKIRIEPQYPPSPKPQHYSFLTSVCSNESPPSSAPVSAGVIAIQAKYAPLLACLHKLVSLFCVSVSCLVSLGGLLWTRTFTRLRRRDIVCGFGFSLADLESGAATIVQVPLFCCIIVFHISPILMLLCCCRV